jgi:hypothetical protein
MPLPQQESSMKIKIIYFFLIIATLVGCASNQVAQISQQGAQTENCKATSEKEIAALFDRWNLSLQTGDSSKVVANYTKRSILLPTVSNIPRLTPAEKVDYFDHFLKDGPYGKINMRFIEIGCNTAFDAGLYTFTYAKKSESDNARYTYTYHWNGSVWLITSHHSSLMPETSTPETSTLIKN